MTETASDEMGKVYNQAAHYREYADIARRTHYTMSDRRARTHQSVGALAIVASAIVSTGILTSVNSNHSTAIKVTGGVIALLATVLAGFQTFYKFADIGEKHRLAAANYGQVRRDLELFLARYCRKNAADLTAGLAELDALANRIDALDREGPGYPGRVYDRVKHARKGTPNQ